MRLSFRSKLLAIVATAAFALVALVLSSAVTARHVEGHLADIRRHYLPKVGLRPQLEAQFERIQRGFQDAVAASDSERLARTVELKKQLLQQLADASDAVEPALSAALALAIEDYHDTGQVVSARLIAHEIGEGVVAQMAEMQAKQARVAELLDRATLFDRSELTKAFSAAAEAQQNGSRVRLGLSIACLVVLLLLSLWISRDLLRGLAHLTAGFRRFGEGDFGSAIPVVSGDELGDLARQANQMAQSLQRLESERSGVDWLKNAQSGLSEQLRGELEPREVADRAVSFLCRRLDCPVGALYTADPDGVFRALGLHTLSAGEDVPGFHPGEGLLGQAALRTDITVVQAPADQLRVRSGLAEGSARSIVLVPLLRVGKVIGVLEVVGLRPWQARSTELLASVRESIAIALEAARGRAELRALLVETQQQTRELEAQRGALEEKNAALVDTRRRLEQQAEELTRASAYKSQFLANMSHELRTPLNSIIGFAELLREGEVGPLEAQQKEFLGDVLRSGRHLLQLINDVLDLSKVEAGKLDFRPERIEPGKLVSEVLAILRSTASARRLQVQAWVDPALGELTVDPGRLKQIMYNYLSNAIKFTPEGGNVSIRMTAEGEHDFRLEVEDTGKGIAPDDLSRLFVEFQQIHDGREKRYGGTGLGLALTKRLVEAQGGSVGVRSTLGQGSTFHAVLPRRSRDLPAAPQVRPAVVRGGAPTVLVIEDDLPDQERLIAILSGAGYSVQLAATGAAALELCKKRSFDAITLDLLLPDMSGLEVLKRIRAEAANQEVPVIVVTVVAERDTIAGFAVQDVLPKPVDAAALLSALTRAGVPPDGPGTILVVDDDPSSLKLVSTTLKQLGYRTRCARDGAAALHWLGESLPSAVILDLVMPGMNGFEFLERLRSGPAGRRVPVIVWTVKDLSPEERTFLRESAHAVVSKGEGGSRVLAELEAAVHRQEQAL